MDTIPSDQEEHEQELFREGCCPYCNEELGSIHLHIHLNSCDVYNEIVDRTENIDINSRWASLRNSISQANPNEIFDSDEDIHISSSSDSVSVSEYENLGYSFPFPFDSRLDTPQFGYTFMKHSKIPSYPCVYPLRPQSKHNRQFIGCPVCFNEYNVISHFPLVLPACGHTACKVCLEKIAEERSVIKCPVCRSMNFKEVYSLPVNYALLDVSEHKEHKELCSKHNSEIIAYCKDDDVLLCGACVFDHKAHDSFLLSDSRATEVAKNRMENIDSQEKEINKVKRIWQTAAKEMKTYTDEINIAMEIHTGELKKHAKIMIKKIKENTAQCINQLGNFLQKENIEKVKKKINEKIKIVNNELKLLDDKKSKYEELSIIEKLKKPSIEALEDKEPPNIDNFKAIVAKLRLEINYEDAIMNMNFPLK
ncbi:unnamed protein product [Blepharisma stoltei]|uniref:RING-type domain-containing protein n=1 Tax=Blepharisma stoltei TaxID=1481888 RepID=A0AAU9J3D3_9CILI|nr:unnamed protein product [Blepharisma stoltei]